MGIAEKTRSMGWQRLLVEPRRPASIRNKENAYWLAVAAVCIGAFMGQLDASIVTVALPTLQRTFHASVGAVTWVGLSYLLVLVATVTAVGRFADMWGRKLLYIYGFAIFVIGSALCGLAPSLGALIGFRVLQAIGAAMLQANSVAIIVLAVPRASLGKAIGIQGAAQAVGLALGPSVGGFLLAAGGWRLIFMVNVPFGVLGVIAGLLLIPRSLHLGDRVPFDWKGLSLFFPAVVAVLSVISFGNSYGWTSPLIMGTFAFGVILAAAFVVRERRVSDPMLDLSLFSRPRFRWGITSGLLSYLVMFGVLFLVPFYFERGLGIGAERAGLELMMMPLALGIVAPFAGRLADHLGAHPLTIGGMSLVAIGVFALGALRPSTLGFLGLLALIGAGLGFFTPPNNAAIMGSVPQHQSGLASGVLNMTRGMGTALGLALTALVFDLAGGTSLAPSTVDHAFSFTTFFLGVAAAGAVLLSALGNRGPLSGSAFASVE
ncbi:MAG: DHA2 family efflux MFS transporter permease subunit [Acidimicrobiales bacterium]